MTKFYELQLEDDNSAIVNIATISVINPKTDKEGMTNIIFTDGSVFTVTHHSLMLALDHAKVPYMVFTPAEETPTLAEVSDDDIVEATTEAAE